MSKLSLIAAMDQNRLIGKGNGLPWHLPTDLKRFKTVTMGKPIIMGRKTHESIGRVLPGRCNIIISQQANYQVPGATVVPTLTAALTRAAEEDSDEWLLIGGGSLYAAALPQVQRMYLTIIEDRFSGDTWFPEWNPLEWRLIKQEAPIKHPDEAFGYRFEIWQRREEQL